MSVSEDALSTVPSAVTASGETPTVEPVARVDAGVVGGPTTGRAAAEPNARDDATTDDTAAAGSSKREGAVAPAPPAEWEASMRRIIAETMTSQHAQSPSPAVAATPAAALRSNDTAAAAPSAADANNAFMAQMMRTMMQLPAMVQQQQQQQQTRPDAAQRRDSQAADAVELKQLRETVAELKSRVNGLALAPGPEPVHRAHGTAAVAAAKSSARTADTAVLHGEQLRHHFSNLKHLNRLVREDVAEHHEMFASVRALYNHVHARGDLDVAPSAPAAVHQHAIAAKRATVQPAAAAQAADAFFDDATARFGAHGHRVRAPPLHDGVPAAKRRAVSSVPDPAEHAFVWASTSKRDKLIELALRSTGAYDQPRRTDPGADAYQGRAAMTALGSGMRDGRRRAMMYSGHQGLSGDAVQPAWLTFPKGHPTVLRRTALHAARTRMLKERIEGDGKRLGLRVCQPMESWPEELQRDLVERRYNPSILAMYKHMAPAPTGMDLRLGAVTAGHSAKHVAAAEKSVTTSQTADGAMSVGVSSVMGTAADAVSFGSNLHFRDEMRDLADDIGEQCVADGFLAIQRAAKAATFDTMSDMALAAPHDTQLAKHVSDARDAMTDEEIEHMHAAAQTLSSDVSRGVDHCAALVECTRSALKSANLDHCITQSDASSSSAASAIKSASSSLRFCTPDTEADLYGGARFLRPAAVSASSRSVGFHVLDEAVVNCCLKTHDAAVQCVEVAKLSNAGTHDGGYYRRDYMTPAELRARTGRLQGVASKSGTMYAAERDANVDANADYWPIVPKNLAGTWTATPATAANRGRADPMSLTGVQSHFNAFQAHMSTGSGNAASFAELHPSLRDHTVHSRLVDAERNFTVPRMPSVITPSGLVSA